MTYKFSHVSQERLDTVHNDLKLICQRLIQVFDFSVFEGVRTPERQKQLFLKGYSQTLDSKHLPGCDGLSRAIDIAPFPHDADDIRTFYFMGGLFMGIAESLGIKVRWGGDWNQNGILDDQSFYDLYHFELVDDGKKAD